MRDSRWRDAKSKRLRDSPSWLHIFFLKLFVSRLPVSRIRSYLFASRLPTSNIYSYSLRISFTRIPNLLLISSYLVYSHPVSALYLFSSRLLASRICSSSLRISFTRNPNLLLSLRISLTRIPYLLQSFTLYKNPVKCLNRLSLLRL